MTNYYHPLSRPIKTFDERAQVPQKPDGLWRCPACRMVWHGHQLHLDPLQTATTWLCAELSCGGHVTRLPRTDRDLPAGRYLYHRPWWKGSKVLVTIEEGPQGEKLVLFDGDTNYFPVDLRDIPADGLFWPVQVTYKRVYCQYSQYHDQTATVVRELTPEEIGPDAEEVGRMWRIRFADENEINVFPEEIFSDGVMAQL